MCILKVLPKMASKSGQTANFSAEELLVESRGLFSGIESKAYDNKRLTKKAKVRKEIENTNLRVGLSRYCSLT